MSTVPDALAGQATGKESSLSNWAGPYVTDMLGKGKALSEQPYQAYQGPLTAGTSALQNKAFQGIANLTVPTGQNMSFTPSSFTQPGTAQQFMNPYLKSALAPQIQEMTRQNDIQKQATRGELAKAGAYGGSRQAIMESEANRNLNDNIQQLLSQGYMDAYNQGQNQFNTEQNLNLQATGQNQNYGLAALNTQTQAGNLQREIEQEGIAADYKQFEQERADPYQQIRFQQSLLQGLPIAAQNYSYQAPSAFNQFMSSAGGITNLISELFGD